MGKFKFKRVIVWKHNGEYSLCHTLCEMLNPFCDFKTEEEARVYANANNLACDKDVFCGQLSEWTDK